MDGFMAILVGQNVPYQKIHEPTPAEQKFWQQYRQQLAAQASAGMTSEQVLYALRTPGLAWADPDAPHTPQGNGPRRSVRRGGVPVAIPPNQLGPTHGARPPAGQR
jgi:hypothetical protein